MSKEEIFTLEDFKENILRQKNYEYMDFVNKLDIKDFPKKPSDFKDNDWKSTATSP